jgi:DNA-directed RNA polymerase subunit RPC12/RpoP
MASQNIKCPGCKKHFPLNPMKHQKDDTVSCPFCRTTVKNDFKDPNWKPNEKYQQGRVPQKPFTLNDMRRILGLTAAIATPQPRRTIPLRQQNRMPTMKPKIIAGEVIKEQ